MHDLDLLLVEFHFFFHSFQRRRHRPEADGAAVKQVDDRPQDAPVPLVQPLGVDIEHIHSTGGDLRVDARMILQQQKIL